MRILLFTVMFTAAKCHYARAWNDKDCAGVVNEYYGRLRNVRIALCAHHAACTICGCSLATHPADYFEPASWNGTNGVWAVGGAHLACAYYCLEHQACFPRSAVCSHFYRGGDAGQ